MDLVDIVTKFGLPLLGAVAGFVTTSYAVRSDVRSLKLKFNEQKKQTKHDHEEFKTEVKREIKEIKESLDKWQRESNHSFASDEELSEFISEQQRQWQQVQRTLGQIEGEMRKR